MASQPIHTYQKTFFGKFFAITIGLIISVIVAEILIRVVMPHWRNFHSGYFIQSTSVPGHANVHIGVPGFDDYFAQNNGDFRVRITINDFGLRNPDPITKANDRIWVVGDSMTFGWGVEQQQMYSSLITNLSGQQTYNVASPGTSVCGYRALVDRMPKNVKPNAVVVGLVLENDVLRYDCSTLAHETKSNSVLVEPITFFSFKRFLTRYFALYNFVSLTLKKIPLIEHALIYVGLAAESHQYLQQIKEDELDIAVTETVKELINLKRQLPNDTPFAILIVPSRFEIRDSNPHYQKLRTKIISTLKKSNIPSIDPIDGFLEKGFTATHFPHDGHWNVLGHKIAATAVNNWISKLPK